MLVLCFACVLLSATFAAGTSLEEGGVSMGTMLWALEMIVDAENACGFTADHLSLMRAGVDAFNSCMETEVAEAVCDEVAENAIVPKAEELGISEEDVNRATGCAMRGVNKALGSADPSMRVYDDDLVDPNL